MSSKKSGTEEKNKITLDIGVQQKGNIKVHSQIINDLSSGIYSSPASCVKELINNAFDAEATLVTIRVKPIEDSITIIDNGYGMNAHDFDNNFAWISKSNKRNQGSRSPKLKRPLIGKIGIGFIAVNEICEELEIISTKEGESVKFTANINFRDYYQNDTKVDGGIIKGAFSLINENESKSEHYTIIRLLGLKESVRDILDDKQYLSELVRSKNKDFDKVRFDNMKDLLGYHNKKNLKSFSEDNAYTQFIIDLSSFIPVEYIEGGPVEGKNNKVISELVQLHKKLDFKVDLDGIYLKKPIFFSKKEYAEVVSFDDSISIANETIKFKGYFYIQHGLLIPRELNGVSIRIRNIPIAEQYGYDTTFMRYPNNIDQIFRNWISGEIYVEEGLEGAMNIDRKSFRLTHPHYLALQNYLHKFLRERVFKKALAIYEENRDDKSEVSEKLSQEGKRRILKTKKITFTKSKDRNKHSSVKIREEKSKSPIRIIKNSSSKTIVEVNDAIVKKFKKKDWAILENIFIIFEIAFKESEGDITLFRELFYSKINEWKNIK